MCEVISSRTQHAKKSHQCVWCGELINPGDRYLYLVIKFDGEFQYNRWHRECAEASYDYENLGDGFDAGSFKRGTADYKFG